MSDKQSGKQPQQLLNYPRDPPSFPPPSCPRCSSSKTKFCYYNNYSALQPRYFCKDCRRYWTHGGAIRNFPNNGTNRKQGRVTSASSSSQSSLPTARSMGSHDVPIGSSTSQLLLSQHSGLLYPKIAPKSWSTGSTNNPAGGGTGSSIGGGTFRLPINETNRFFTGGDFFNRKTFMFSPDVELGTVNNSFGAVNACFVGEAPPQPVPPSPFLRHLSLVGGSCELGIPFLQPRQHKLIPSPLPTTWTTQNMASNSASTNNLIQKTQEMTAVENVVSINEWPKFDDMDIEGGPLQSYKSPSP